MNRALWILWPSFVVAGAASAVFFNFTDPAELPFVGPHELSRTAGYSMGFLFFWAVAAASSGLTCFLQRRP